MIGGCWPKESPAGHQITANGNHAIASKKPVIQALRRLGKTGVGYLRTCRREANKMNIRSYLELTNAALSSMESRFPRRG